MPARIPREISNNAGELHGLHLDALLIRVMLEYRLRTQLERTSWYRGVKC